MTRRATRRTYAILGLIADNGDATAGVAAATLRLNVTDVIFELQRLERQGRVVCNLSRSMPPRRFYRLPTDAERRAHAAATRPSNDTPETRT